MTQAILFPSKFISLLSAHGFARKPLNRSLEIEAPSEGCTQSKTNMDYLWTHHGDTHSPRYWRLCMETKVIILFHFTWSLRFNF